MVFALCPGPFFSLDELFGLMMSAVSYCSLPVLVVLAFLKWAGARRSRLNDEYSILPNDRRT